MKKYYRNINSTYVEYSKYLRPGQVSQFMYTTPDYRTAEFGWQDGVRNSFLNARNAMGSYIYRRAQQDTEKVQQALQALKNRAIDPNTYIAGAQRTGRALKAAQPHVARALNAAGETIGNVANAATSAARRELNMGPDDLPLPRLQARQLPSAPSVVSAPAIMNAEIIEDIPQQAQVQARRRQARRAAAAQEYRQSQPQAQVPTPGKDGMDWRMMAGLGAGGLGIGAGGVYLANRLNQQPQQQANYPAR